MKAEKKRMELERMQRGEKKKRGAESVEVEAEKKNPIGKERM